MKLFLALVALAFVVSCSTAVDRTISISNAVTESQDDVSNSSNLAELSTAEIKTIQFFLNQSTKMNVDTDGFWGPQTQSATKVWQVRNDFPASGILSDAQLRAMRQESSFNRSDSSTVVAEANSGHLVKISNKEKFRYDRDEMRRLTAVSPKVINVSNGDLCPEESGFKGDRISDPTYSQDGSQLLDKAVYYDSNPTFCLKDNISLSFAEYSYLVFRKLELRYSKSGQPESKFTEAYFRGIFVPTRDDLVWAYYGSYIPTFEEAQERPNILRCITRSHSFSNFITGKSYQGCVNIERRKEWGSRFGTVHALPTGAYLGEQSINGDQILVDMFVRRRFLCNANRLHEEVIREAGLHAKALTSVEFLQAIDRSPQLINSRGCVRENFANFNSPYPLTLFDFVINTHSRVDHPHWKNRWASQYGKQLQQRFSSEEREIFYFPNCPDTLDIYQECR